MQARLWPHGSPGDAKHRPETRRACHRAALRADPLALLTMRGKRTANPCDRNGLQFALDPLCDAALWLVPRRVSGHIRRMKKTPFRLTPYQVQFLLVVGFLTVGYALYLRYLAVEYSPVALACDAGLQSTLCKMRALATYLFKNSVFGIVAMIIAVLHVMRPSIVLLTAGLVAAGLGIVLYNIVLSGLAIGLLILGFARPAPATA
jgi:hypothetical protein